MVKSGNYAVTVDAKILCLTTKTMDISCLRPLLSSFLQICETSAAKVL